MAGVDSQSINEMGEGWDQDMTGVKGGGLVVNVEPSKADAAGDGTAILVVLTLKSWELCLTKAMPDAVLTDEAGDKDIAKGAWAKCRIRLST